MYVRRVQENQVKQALIRQRPAMQTSWSLLLMIAMISQDTDIEPLSEVHEPDYNNNKRSDLGKKTSA